MVTTVGNQPVATPRAALRNGQIIIGFFALGIVLFLGVAAILVISAAAPPPVPGMPVPGMSGSGSGAATSSPGFMGISPPVFAGALSVLIVAAMGIGVVTRLTMIARAKGVWANRTDDEQAINTISGLHLQASILRAVPVEGLGLLAAAVFFLDGSWLMLGPGLLSVLLLIVGMPTRTQMASFIEAATGGTPAADASLRP